MGWIPHRDVKHFRPLHFVPSIVRWLEYPAGIVSDSVGDCHLHRVSERILILNERAVGEYVRPASCGSALIVGGYLYLSADSALRGRNVRVSHGLLYHPPAATAGGAPASLT
jgi:hypothetical protein